MPEQQQLDPIMLKAIDWMVLLESGLATSEDQQNFQAWLNEKPLHQQIWQELQHSLNSPFEQLQQQSLSAKLPAKVAVQSILTANKQRTNPIFKGGIALLVMIGISSTIWFTQSRPLSFLKADYYTQTAEQKQIQLQDGSMVTLSAHSAIQVDYQQHQRNIYLLEGALIAKVTADRQRPFTIYTKQAKMQALGTEFMVSQSRDYSDLAVLEHSVQASNSHQVKTVPEGQSVRVDSYQIQNLSSDAASLSGWRDGVLQAEDMPLAEFIEQVRPFYKGYIYLNDEVKNVKVYGVFYLNDPDKILATLASTQGLKITQTRLGLTFISKQ